jgi:dolichol-phosphate mannosyltransferase
MARFAWTAISSFSALPLKLSLAGGLCLTAFGIAYSAWVLYEALVLKSTVRGWSSLVCLHLLFSGAILTGLGLVGDYVARIYEEVKGRPLYVVTEAVNLAPDAAPPARALRLGARLSCNAPAMGDELPGRPVGPRSVQVTSNGERESR